MPAGLFMSTKKLAIIDAWQGSRIASYDTVQNTSIDKLLSPSRWYTQSLTSI